MHRRLPAARAIFFKLEPVRGVAPILARNVVSLLANLAGEGNLGANV